MAQPVRSQTLLRTREDVATARTEIGRVSALVSSLNEGYVKRKFQQALRDAEYDVSNAERNVVSRSSPQRSARAEQPSTQHPVDTLEGDIRRRLERAHIQPNSACTAIAAAVHCMILDQGLACFGPDAASAVPGFSPPIREIPASRLLPPDWSEDPNAVSLTYRHPKLRGNIQFTLSCVTVGDNVAIHLTKTDGELHVIQVPADDFVHLDGSGNLENFTNLEGLQSRFQRECLQPLLPNPSPEPQQQVPRPAPAPIPAPRPDREPRPGPGYPSGPGFIPPGNVGGGDLWPAGLGGSAGNLVGPDHPMFSGGDEFNPGAPFPSHLPQPRFDPYGPVPGPNMPQPGRLGGRGGRGRGRGRGRTTGEPNPDHLRPPHEDDDNMFT